MAEYLPLRDPGKAITAQTSADVVGGQLVEITGDNKVGPASAGSTKVRGVAAFDAKSGETVTVRSGGDQVVAVSGAVTAGDQVSPAAGGTVAKGSSPAVGVVVVGASEGGKAVVAFDR